MLERVPLWLVVFPGVGQRSRHGEALNSSVAKNRPVACGGLFASGRWKPENARRSGTTICRDPYRIAAVKTPSLGQLPRWRPQIRSKFLY